MCISIVDSEMPSIQNKGKEKLGKCFHFTLSFRITVISSSIFICRIAKLARWLENVKIQLYFCPSELGIVKWEAPTQFPPFLPERHKQVSLFSSRFFFFPKSILENCALLLLSSGFKCAKEKSEAEKLHSVHVPLISVVWRSYCLRSYLPSCGSLLRTGVLCTLGWQLLSLRSINMLLITSCWSTLFGPC